MGANALYSTNHTHPCLGSSALPLVSVKTRAGDGIRTHGPVLGKHLRYHCATPAYANIIAHLSTASNWVVMKACISLSGQAIIRLSAPVHGGDRPAAERLARRRRCAPGTTGANFCPKLKCTDSPGTRSS